MKNIWVICPVYNESQFIIQFLLDLTDSLNSFIGYPLGSELSKYHFHILLINDGSKDRSLETILHHKDHRSSPVSLEVVSFSRNFGHQAAVVAGLIKATEKGADAVITMDSDGEHPVEVLPKLIWHWEKGHLIVHTRRKMHRDLSIFKRLTSHCFYQLMSFAGSPIQNGMADFKLWDGGLLREVKEFLPKCGSTRLFASWVYPTGPIVEYQQKVAFGKVSHFNFRKMCSFANRSFFLYSDMPLRFSVAVGAAAIVLSLFYLIYVLIAHFGGNTIPGWTSLAVVILFLGGVQIFSIGLLGEYLLQRVFRSQVPLYVLRDNKTN